MVKLHLQPHEKKLILKMEERASAQISSEDINMFIRVLRRRFSSLPECVHLASISDFAAEVENPELFKRSGNFLFIQNGRFHKDIESVDTGASYLILQQDSFRETDKGKPICNVCLKK